MGYILGLYREYIGIMEKKMESTVYLHSKRPELVLASSTEVLESRPKICKCLVGVLDFKV